MTSTANLVPITRVFLAKFYDKHPFDPLVPEFNLLDAQIQNISEILKSESSDSSEALKILEVEIPHKIDENLWKNREQLEEILFLLKLDNLPDSLKKEPATVDGLKDVIDKAAAQLKDIEEYQKFTSGKVFEMVLTYLPQDFRGTLIKLQRERSEARRQQEVEALVQSGGSIAEKYALLWQQQMDRRQTLASLGSASGIYKTLVQYLVGVPQVLLDFVKQINDKNGPMEEQRDRYGPHLYDLTNFIRRVRVFLSLWWTLYDSQPENAGEYLNVFKAAMEVYVKEFTRLLHTLKTVFANAPFLISAEDAMSAEDKSNLEAFKEVNISSGTKFEFPLPVELENSFIAWDFTLPYGKDVGFSVDFANDSGEKKTVFEYQRIEKHQGSHNAAEKGVFTFTWDNSYSFINSKTVKYKVDSIPPVETEEQIEAEEKLASLKLDSATE